MDIKIGGDGRTPTEVDCVVLDHRSALLSLDVDAVGVARYDLVLDDIDHVLRACLQHDPARLEVLEVAVLNVDVGVDSDDTSRVGIVRGVTLELAVDHFDAGTLKNRDARHLAIGFPENTTKETLRRFRRCSE